MSILLLLIPLSVLFVVVGGVAFFWAANRRQFDNVDAAAFLPMIDSDVAPDARPAPASGSDSTPTPTSTQTQTSTSISTTSPTGDARGGVAADPSGGATGATRARADPNRDGSR